MVCHIEGRGNCQSLQVAKTAFKSARGGAELLPLCFVHMCISTDGQSIFYLVLVLILFFRFDISIISTYDTHDLWYQVFMYVQSNI